MSKYWIDYDHPTGALMRDKTVLVDNILAGIGGDGVTSVLNRETIALGNELFAMTKDRDEWKAATIDANKRFAAAEDALRKTKERIEELEFALYGDIDDVRKHAIHNGEKLIERITELEAEKARLEATIDKNLSTSLIDYDATLTPDEELEAKRLAKEISDD